MTLGPSEIGLFAVLYLIPIGVLIDGARMSKETWNKAGYSKNFWLTTQTIGTVIGFGIVLCLLYLVMTRPKLMKAAPKN
jgi:hypothetical protein